MVGLLLAGLVQLLQLQVLNVLILAGVVRHVILMFSGSSVSLDHRHGATDVAFANNAVGITGSIVARQPSENDIVINMKQLLSIKVANFMKISHLKLSRTLHKILFHSVGEKESVHKMHAISIAVFKNRPQSP